MKVLIVEDDRISSALLEKALVDMGHEVKTAINGNYALKLVHKVPIQLIITDWMMPEMDGLELCRHVRDFSDKRYMYIIMLTIKDEKEDMVRVLQSGADDFVSKPFDIDELRARVTTGERIVTLNEKLIQTSDAMQEKNNTLKATLKRLEDTQAQMLQSEKMASIGQLAAGVAHEINNPTGFVSSNLKTLADYQQLNQVFMNILVNAAQAIEKQGVIKITTSSNNGHVEVAISDNGCGIENKNLGKIFEPFFTTKNVGRGTGLGMHIAYKIIEKHHGRISVASQVGKGTTFTIRLPVEEE